MPSLVEEHERNQDEDRDENRERELPDISEERRRRDPRMFGDRFDEQIGRVADVGQRAKETGSQ